MLSCAYQVYVIMTCIIYTSDACGIDQVSSSYDFKVHFRPTTGNTQSLLLASSNIVYKPPKLNMTPTYLAQLNALLYIVGWWTYNLILLPHLLGGNFEQIFPQGNYYSIYWFFTYKLKFTRPCTILLNQFMYVQGAVFSTSRRSIQ